MRGVAVLGSTGTIGSNTLNVIEQFSEEFRVVSLAAGKNIDKLRTQIRQFRPDMVTFQDSSKLSDLEKEFPGVSFDTGERGLNACVSLRDVEIVVVGIVGFAAMSPTLAAIRAGKTVALANKEVLVAGGGALFREELLSSGATCIPVDSEHNALFQLLEGRDRSEIQSLVITASGGPFFRQPELVLDNVTPQMAVRHPNWKMGPKISVDSATLMNKGLELIEAAFLFEVNEKKIEIWIHPQSILHGAVWFKDNSCMAQLSKPDMRSSIGYALSYPERLPNVISKLSLQELRQLEFFEPDDQRFPALKLAREALKAGSSHLVALNASNEVAVESFLNGKILFPQITQVVEEVLTAHKSVPIHQVEDIFHLDEDVRRIAFSGVSLLS